MHIAKTYNDETFIYWNLIKNVSKEVKLRLITLLSQSLTNDSEKPKKTDKKATEDFIAKYCGAWTGDATAEDIIDIIQRGKTCKDPISFD